MGSPSVVQSLLLLLALLLEPSGSQAQLKFRMQPGEKLEVQPSQQVQLKCETLGASNTGCSWLYLRPGDMVPTFLLYISSTTSSVKYREGLDTGQFHGEKLSATLYTLTVKKFRQEDQGYYYCVVTRNSAMFFSPSVSVFLPVKATTTHAPKPKPTTVLATTRSSNENSAGSEKCKSPNSKEKTGLDFSCDLYIWMPLTGVCAVLLLALITTIIICQKDHDIRKGHENESAGVQEARWSFDFRQKTASQA